MRADLMSIAVMGKTKRNITDTDRAAARELSRLWGDYKRKNPGTTQEKAGSKIGLSQAVFSQYLLCTIPLGTDAAIKFANLFGVAPSQIRSDLDPLINETTNRHKVTEADRSYQQIPDEAIEIARAWLALPAARRHAIRDQIFIEAAVSRHFPWLRIGIPTASTYAEFEKKLGAASKKPPLKHASKV